jgi:cyclase
MSEIHNIDVLHFHFPPSPAIALPNQTFAKEYSAEANREKLKLQHVYPAHTDTDIYIHFQNANVVRCGDLVINNGGFPLIDYETGGKIAGMVAASNRILALADKETRIVPGHGSLADKATVKRFRDMLVIVHERISGLKSQGKTLDEVVAVKPLADLDPKWGAGLLNSDQYTEIVYRSL